MLLHIRLHDPTYVFRTQVVCVFSLASSAQRVLRCVCVIHIHAPLQVAASVVAVQVHAEVRAEGHAEVRVEADAVEAAAAAAA